MSILDESCKKGGLLYAFAECGDAEEMLAIIGHLGSLDAICCYREEVAALYLLGRVDRLVWCRHAIAMRVLRALLEEAP